MFTKICLHMFLTNTLCFDFDFETVRENVKLVILRATRIANFLWPLSTVVGAD